MSNQEAVKNGNVGRNRRSPRKAADVHVSISEIEHCRISGAAVKKDITTDNIHGELPVIIYCQGPVGYGDLNIRRFQPVREREICFDFGKQRHHVLLIRTICASRPFVRVTAVA